MSKPSCRGQCASQRAFAVLKKAWNLEATPDQTQSQLPETSRQRRQSAIDVPIDIAELLDDSAESINNKQETVLYLAYGSNLSAETFKGTRGIEPLSQVNVLVPSLALTFDLPGIPYSEPCFANTRRRDASESEMGPKAEAAYYHKDRWHKGLVGVVYEVTLADYATIIATEGGGASYQDIVVQCYEIPSGTKVVDAHPNSTPFAAHTLFSPQSPAGEKQTDGRSPRPDPSYAQASARYLKLISNGAEEHDLPKEYQDYLHSLRSYTITSKRQRAGQVLFLSMWLPFVVAIFVLGRLLANKHGKTPVWLQSITKWIFAGMWLSYDNAFRKVFGDGERTEKKAEDDIEDEAVRKGEEQPLLQKKNLQESAFSS